MSEGRKTTRITTPEGEAEFWKQRYETQHRTLRSCEDKLAEARADRDEAIKLASDVILVLPAKERQVVIGTMLARLQSLLDPTNAGAEGGGADPNA